MQTCERCGDGIRLQPGEEPTVAVLSPRLSVPACSAECAAALEDEARQTSETKERQRAAAVAAHAVRKEEKEKLAAERAVREAASIARNAEAARLRKEAEDEMRRRGTT
jgi:hypothetical protein